MLRASLLANTVILPQARQGSYLFNSIGQKQAFMSHEKPFIPGSPACLTSPPQGTSMPWL
jgi:hypothetical protein